MPLKPLIPNWTRRDSIFVALATLLVLGYVAVAGWGFPLDDAWIHQTFARNLATNGEWAFIPGTPSAASTSPLYTAVLSIGYALGIPYMLWTHGLGVIALAAAAMIASRLGAVVASDEQEHRAAWATGLAVLLTWHHIWAATSGMETMLFGTLTLWLILLAWREWNPERNHTRRYLLMRGAGFGIVTALTGLARPEGIMLGGFVALALLLLRPQGNVQRVIIWGLGAAIGFSLFIAPYLWLNLSITGGDLLPDTAAAKFEQHAILLGAPYPLRMISLFVPIFSGGQILLVPGMLIYAVIAVQRQQWHALLPLLWGVALVLLYAARLPATYQHGRYVIPALPALVTSGAIGTVWLWQWSQRQRLRRVLVQSLVLSTVLVYLGFLYLGADALRRDVAVINGEMVASAMWIDDNLPDDDLLAIHDIGAVGYFAPRELLDIAGLASPDVIPIVDDPDALWSLMRDRDANYLMAFPNQIPGGDVDDPRLCPIYTTDAAITQQLGEPNMTIYELAWDETCDATAP